MIELNKKLYQVSFCELGDYDDYIVNYKTLKEAIRSQNKLIKDNPENGYYTTISKILIIKRKEENENEQSFIGVKN